MKYPSVSDYIESVKLVGNNFSTLTNLRPVTDSSGQPILKIGESAVVFKMFDVNTSHFYAVRCFLGYQDQQIDYYQHIKEALKDVSNNYFVPFQYYDNEIYVSCNSLYNKYYPVLLMDWVEGYTLESYITKFVDDRYKLLQLTYKFSQLTNWLLSQSFAHGSIDKDNILINADGQIKLVDYDNMFTPSMKEKGFNKKCKSSIRNPLHKDCAWGECMDDFPLILILLSLKIISNQPNLFKQRKRNNHLLFSDSDLLNLSTSHLYKENVLNYLDNNDFRILNGLFLLSYSNSPIKGISFELTKPFTTVITEDDWKEAILYGSGWFSKDGKRFYGIKKPFRDNPFFYSDSLTLEGEDIEVICDNSISIVNTFSSISLPPNLKAIGNNAFHKIDKIGVINFPESLEFIFGNPFSGVIIDKIENSSIHFSVDGLAIYTSDQKKIISYYSNNTEFKIDSSVEEIGEEAFAENEFITCVKMGNSVKQISNRAFAKCPALKAIQLPSSLEKIGEEAFLHSDIYPSIPISVQKDWGEMKSYCSLKIVIPHSVQSIGRRAFIGVKSLRNESPFFNIIEETLFTTNGEKLIYYFGKKDVYIVPNGVKVICDSAFMNNQHIKTIIISESVEEIEAYSFAQCRELSKVQFKSDKTVIKRGAFCCCHKLVKINIPKQLECIDDWTFENCDSLAEVHLPQSLSKIGDGAFNNCLSLSKIMIPENVTYIGNNSFQNCLKLEEIHLPNNLSYINSDTFSSCFNLKKIDFPEKLKEIKESSFYECKSLEEVHFPSSLMKVNHWAFGCCKSLIKCVLSNPSTIIVKDAFKYVNDDFKLYLPKGGDAKNYYGIMPESVYGFTDYGDWKMPNIDNKIENIIPFLEDTPLEDILSKETSSYNSFRFYDTNGGVYADGKQTFLGIDRDFINKKKDFTIQDGTKYICDNAFNKNSSIKFYDYEINCCPIVNINLPDSIIAIGKKSFAGTRIEKLKLPQSLIFMGDFAFEECYSLHSITLPRSIEFIGKNPFKGTNRLFSIISESPFFTVRSNCLISTRISLLIHCFQSSKINLIEDSGLYKQKSINCLFTIPHGVKTIGEFSFTIAEITDIIIPNTVENVEQSAFEGNKLLESINMSNSVITLDENAFKGCQSLKQIHLSESLTSLCDNLFENCKKLEEVSIPKNVNHIGKSVFKFCESLKTILIPKNVKIIDTNPFEGSGIDNIICESDAFEIFDNILYTTNKKRIISCLNNNKKIVLPNGLQEIGDYAFCKCKNLEIIIVPKSIKKIGVKAFSHCSSLRKIVISGSSLTRLEEFSFSDCTSLNEIYLPYTIKIIEKGVFNNCTSLKSIELPFCISKIENDAFQNCSLLKTIWLPTGVKKEILPWDNRRYGKKMTTDSYDIWTDEYGVAYSKDRKTLVRANKRLKKYAILDGVVKIADNAFGGCSDLRKLSIPSSVKYIGDNVFTYCGIRRLKLPDSLKILGHGVFGFEGICPLKEISFPSSLKIMDGNPFLTCNPQKVTNHSKYFKIIDNTIYTSNLEKIVSCMKKDAIIRIPNIVKTIGKYAFNSDTLVHILIPESVKKIEIGAFNWCHSLKRITILNPNIQIDENAFEFITNNMEIIIPINTLIKFVEMNPKLKTITREQKEENEI